MLTCDPTRPDPKLKLVVTRIPGSKSAMQNWLDKKHRRRHGGEGGTTKACVIRHNAEAAAAKLHGISRLEEVNGNCIFTCE